MALEAAEGTRGARLFRRGHQSPLGQAARYGDTISFFARSADVVVTMEDHVLLAVSAAPYLRNCQSRPANAGRAHRLARQIHRARQTRCAAHEVRHQRRGDASRKRALPEKIQGCRQSRPEGRGVDRVAAARWAVDIVATVRTAATIRNAPSFPSTPGTSRGRSCRPRNRRRSSRADQRIGANYARCSRVGAKPGAIRFIRRARRWDISPTRALSVSRGFRRSSLLAENGFSAMWNERRELMPNTDNRLSGLPKLGAGSRTRPGERSRPASSARRNTSRRAIFIRSISRRNSAPVSPEIRIACLSTWLREAQRRARHFLISANARFVGLAGTFSAHPGPARHDASDQGNASAKPRSNSRRATRLRASDRSEGAGRAGDDHRPGAERPRADLRVRQRDGHAARATGTLPAGLPSRLHHRGHVAARDRYARRGAGVHSRRSISGAPKKRACEIIAELEPCPRGIYTGLIGYFDDNGDAAFSIAIRTMVLEGENLHFSVGSGITAGSVPAREYDETLHKAAGMEMALEA